MIEREIFYQRSAICRNCEFWWGACLKGHALGEDAGCPVQKFPGLNGAGYHGDNAEAPKLPNPTHPCCGAKKDVDIQPLSWAGVLLSLKASMAAWLDSGMALVHPAVYAERVKTCKACPKGQYKWFQCRHCKCIVYIKAYPATEDCPLGHWPSRS